MITPRQDELLQRKIDGYIFLFDRKESQLHEMNHTASRIWELLIDKIPYTTISKILCDEFEVDEDQAHLDVTQFIQELEEKKIITIQSQQNEL